MSQENISALGLNIARYRKAEGLSAAEVADRAGEGLSRSIIANLENGRKNDLSLRQLISVAKVLRVPPVALAVDLFAPGESAPYPMPGLELPIFNTQTFEIEPTRTPTRNVDFLRWFSGESFFTEEPSDGAPAMARGVLSALHGYRQSWSALSRALHRFVGFSPDPDNAEVQDEFDRRHERVIQEAVSTVRWVHELRSKGARISDVEKSIQETLDRANVKFDYETDSLEFPVYGHYFD
ncbi:helix-turn-helix domain-containing protein [Leucobacter sp. W1153]|uniref:helix-turn-helix domain-containing protein n=1 Tax=Leucobacter sp. W1153 TaxID=3439064 RepID=UPI003F379A02